MRAILSPRHWNKDSYAIFHSKYSFFLLTLGYYASQEQVQQEPGRVNTELISPCSSRLGHIHVEPESRNPCSYVPTLLDGERQETWTTDWFIHPFAAAVFLVRRMKWRDRQESAWDLWPLWVLGMNISPLDVGLNEQLTQLSYTTASFFRSTVGALIDS